jgi:hypothetical protein
MTRSRIQLQYPPTNGIELLIQMEELRCNLAINQMLDIQDGLDSFEYQVCG